MRPPLQNRTILVTGGARRLGAVITRHLAGCGARVLVHHRSAADEARRLVEELARTGGGAAAFHGDLAHPAGTRDLLAAIAGAGERLDSIVHAASSFVRVPVLETTSAQWDAAFALHTRALFELAQGLARQRAGAPGPGGAIVAISDSGARELWPGYVAHCVSKGAQLLLVQALAKALAPALRVNAVVPGPTMPPEGMSEADVKAAAERTLLGHWVEPSSIARAVEFFLATPDVTGATLDVTAGAHLWRRAGG